MRVDSWAVGAAGCVLAAGFLFPALAGAQEPVLPRLTMELAAGQAEPGEVSTLLEILFLLTVLTVAPAILLTMTSFTRIIIVFHFLRQAMGTQQMPPNQLIIGLALFLTFFIMAPVLERVHDEAIQPLIEDEIGYRQALDRGMAPLR